MFSAVFEILYAGVGWIMNVAAWVSEDMAEDLSL